MSAQHDMVNIEQLEKCRAENERLRNALQEAVRLYSSYGLLANRVECGRWVNQAREALK